MATRKKKIELIGGPLVVAVSEAINRGCRQPELKRVCCGEGYKVWCITDGSAASAGKYRRHVYHLQGEILTAEYDYVAVVVQNYDAEKLWKTEYRGL